MAESKKITQLQEAQGLSSEDEFIVVDKSITNGDDASTTGKTSKITFSKLKQAVGSQGAPGETGQKGEQGNSVTGPAGPAGPAGPQGTQGISIQGDPGPTGEKGPQGNSVTGPKGPQGNSVTGPKGPQGNSVTGPKGPQGNSVTGAKGSTGAKGPQGNSVTGAKGSTGAKGPQGNSVTGPKGPQGNSVTGPKGPQGNSVTGAKGPQGASGSPWGGGTFTGAVTFSSAGINGNYTQPNNNVAVDGVLVKGQLSAHAKTQNASNWGMIEVNPYNPSFVSSANGIVRINGSNIALTQYSIATGQPNARHMNVSLQKEGTLGVSKIEFGSDAGIISNTSFKFYSNGVFSATSTKNFVIDHPVLPNKELTHVAIEAPRGDLIYRGRVKLEKGNAVANIDESGNMTNGTFVALTRSEDAQLYLQTENSFDLVKGEVIGNEIRVESNNSESSVYVSWMVVAERNDKSYNDATNHDTNGMYITETDKPENTSIHAIKSLNAFDKQETHTKI